MGDRRTSSRKAAKRGSIRGILNPRFYAMHPALKSGGGAETGAIVIMHTVIQFQAQDDLQVFERAVDFARRQLRALIERHPDFYPMYTMQGRWKHSGEAWTHWCDGFLPGMLWILYGMAPDAPDATWWREQAIRYSEPLEPRKLDRNVHDLGFIFMST